MRYGLGSMDIGYSRPLGGIQGQELWYANETGL